MTKIFIADFHSCVLASRLLAHHIALPPPSPVHSMALHSLRPVQDKEYIFLVICSLVFHSFVSMNPTFTQSFHLFVFFLLLFVVHGNGCSDAFEHFVVLDFWWCECVCAGFFLVNFWQCTQDFAARVYSDEFLAEIFEYKIWYVFAIVNAEKNTPSLNGTKKISRGGTNSVANMMIKTEKIKQNAQNKILWAGPNPIFLKHQKIIRRRMSLNISEDER